MARTATLTSEQHRALDRLAQVAVLEAFYLAGGSAVAVHLGHRTSVDLDLFSRGTDVSLDEVRLALVTAIPEFEVVSLTDATLHGRLHGVAVDIVRYPYAPLEKPHADLGGLPVASLLDLATMKVSAIARRGIKRDFWDLYEIIQSTDLTLTGVLDAFLRRFGKSDSDLYHVLRAMTYFEDADAESLMPNGLTSDHWKTIKVWFGSAAPAELKRRLDASS